LQSLSSDERYIVNLDIFEGPLDLLLHLIRTHELDIMDIPMSFITGKYLEYLDFMKQIDLGLAAEYLEMAATLALIKSRMLVPSDESDEELFPEEGPDPREELVRRLLEYQKYKTAALALGELPMLGRDTFPRGGVEEISVDRDIAPPGLFALMEAFQKVLQETDEEQIYEISVTRMSVSDRINQLVDLFRTRRRVTFDDLFVEQRNRPELVVTFISLLEMVKLGLVKVRQVADQSDLHIAAADTIDAVDDIFTEEILEE
jgi:segregation and condensation protein A